MVGMKKFVALMTVLGLLLTFRPAEAQQRYKAASGASSQPTAFYIEQPTNGSAPCPACRYQVGPSCRSCGEIPVLTPLAAWLIDPNTIILPSDFGWSYPIKRAIIRRNLTYQRYWPDQWTGERSKPAVSPYPMVAQPTDTMQLGYYYQHVPTWQPRPDMLPQPPVPSKWHIRKCGYLPDGSYVVWVPLSSIPQKPAAGKPSPQQPVGPQPPAQPQQATPQQQTPPTPPPAPTNTAQVHRAGILR